MGKSVKVEDVASRGTWPAKTVLIINMHFLLGSNKILNPSLSDQVPIPLLVYDISSPEQLCPRNPSLHTDPWLTHRLSTNNEESTPLPTWPVNPSTTSVLSVISNLWLESKI